MIARLATLALGVRRPARSLLAGRRLKDLRARGLPEELAQPVRYLLDERCPPEQRSLAAGIEALRRGLVADDRTETTIYASPESGEPGAVRPSIPRKSRLSHIGRVTSISSYWGLFLHLCTESVGAETVLELGSCAGISGCYLASARSCRQFVTVEGSQELAALAERNLRSVALGEVAVLNAMFDDALDKLLPALEQPLDLVYLDGQHELHATLHYVDRLLPSLRAGGVVILDDIHWTAGMTDAWRILSGRPGFRLALELGRLGLLVQDDNVASPNVIDLSRWTLHWRPDRPRT